MTAVPHTLSRVAAVLLVLAAAFAAVAGAVHAAGRIRVVATIPDLKALTDAVGGDLVEVESLTRGSQNAHDAEIRPTMMLKLRRADLLVENGLELDAWVDVAIQGSNNGRIVRGGLGRLDASQNVPVLEVPTGRVDRSLGDVHPLGNPHYTIDPGLAPIITQTILDGLGRLAPQHRAAFEKNRAAFLARLDGEMAKWTKAMEPLRGAKVVAYHPDFVYFLARFGLVQVGTLEDRPGIPPSPAHLAQLIRRMKDERVRAILVEPWNDQRLAARVAQEAGARAVVIAPGVGAVKGADTYVAAVDYNVRTLVEALR
jgi:ABC-type Zn uptake system ZnuABC Zn-binding protein ZnuA